MRNYNYNPFSNVLRAETVQGAVDILIAKNIDINQRYGNHKTILMSNETLIKLDFIKFFIENGVNINLTDSSGKTALMHAAEKGYGESLVYLLMKQADVNIQDNDGETALIKVIAAQKGSYLFYVDYLLTIYNANINLQNNDGKTGLIYAVLNGDIRMVKCLLDHGADPEIKDNQGKTALMYAIISKNLEIIEYFMKQNINIKNNEVPEDTVIQDYLESFGQYQTEVPSLLRIVLQRFVNGLGGNPNFIDNNIKHNNTTLKELIPYELAIMVDDIIPNVKATEVTYVNPLKSELKSWVDKINFKEKEKFILESEKAGAKSSARINFKDACDAWDALGL